MLSVQLAFSTKSTKVRFTNCAVLRTDRIIPVLFGYLADINRAFKITKLYCTLYSLFNDIVQCTDSLLFYVFMIIHRVRTILITIFCYCHMPNWVELGKFLNIVPTAMIWSFDRVEHCSHSITNVQCNYGLKLGMLYWKLPFSGDIRLNISFCAIFSPHPPPPFFFYLFLFLF